mgnify:CR=1 FL=1
MEWVQIENSKYDINREGQVRSRWKTEPIVLKPYITKYGYAKVYLCYNDFKKCKSIHRLLALAFIDNPENKPLVDHMDRNTSNNSLSNLRWATYSENSHNRLRKGSIGKTKHNTWRVKVLNLEGNQISKSFKTYEEADKWRIDNLVQPTI